MMLMMMLMMVMMVMMVMMMMMMMMIRINEGEKGQRKMVTPVRNLRKAIVLESLRQQESCLSRVEALLQCLLGHMLLSIGS